MAIEDEINAFIETFLYVVLLNPRGNLSIVKMTIIGTLIYLYGNTIQDYFDDNLDGHLQEQGLRAQNAALMRKQKSMQNAMGRPGPMMGGRQMAMQNAMNANYNSMYNSYGGNGMAMSNAYGMGVGVAMNNNNNMAQAGNQINQMANNNMAMQNQALANVSPHETSPPEIVAAVQAQVAEQEKANNVDISEVQ